MATYSPNLGLTLIGTGEQAGTWGDTTNTNLGTLLEQAISGYQTVTVVTGSDTTITIPPGASGTARNMYLEVQGSGGSSTYLTVPAAKKLYFIYNNTAGSPGAVTVRTASGTGISVAYGAKTILVCDGTNIVNATTYGTGSVAGSSNQVQYNSGGAFAGSSNLTFDGTTLTAAGLSGPHNGTVGATTPTTGAFTTATASTGFSGPHNGTVGATTPSTGAFTTLSASSTVTLSGGTTNGVAYLNGSSVLTTGSALSFDGNHLGLNAAPATTPSTYKTMAVSSTSSNLAGFINGTNSATSLNTGVAVNSGGSWVYTIASQPAMRYVQANSSGDHLWYIASGGSVGAAASFTQAMTLRSDGNLLVGTTTTGGSGGISLVPQGAGTNACLEAVWNGTAGFNVAGQFRYNGTTVGQISYDTSNTTYATSSDYRLKDNPQPLTGSGAFIDALQPKTWEWKVDGSRGVGFIAHEVQAISPKTVVGEKDAVDSEGKPVYQAMGYGSPEFIANIIAELQSLRARVAALEAVP